MPSSLEAKATKKREAPKAEPVSLAAELAKGGKAIESFLNDEETSEAKWTEDLEEAGTEQLNEIVENLFEATSEGSQDLVAKLAEEGEALKSAQAPNLIAKIQKLAEQARADFRREKDKIAKDAGITSAKKEENFVLPKRDDSKKTDSSRPPGGYKAGVIRVPPATQRPQPFSTPEHRRQSPEEIRRAVEDAKTPNAEQSKNLKEMFKSFYALLRERKANDETASKLPKNTPDWFEAKAKDATIMAQIYGAREKILYNFDGRENISKKDSNVLINEGIISSENAENLREAQDKEDNQGVQAVISSERDRLNTRRDQEHELAKRYREMARKPRVPQAERPARPKSEPEDFRAKARPVVSPEELSQMRQEYAAKEARKVEAARTPQPTQEKTYKAGEHKIPTAEEISQIKTEQAFKNQLETVREKAKAIDEHQRGSEDYYTALKELHVAKKDALLSIISAKTSISLELAEMARKIVNGPEASSLFNQGIAEKNQSKLREAIALETARLDARITEDEKGIDAAKPAYKKILDKIGNLFNF